VFEFSSKLQTIEIYAPMRDAKGNVTAPNHESIFYDPEAFVEPIRIVRNYRRLSDFDEGDPYVDIECIQTIYPIKGHSTPVSPGTTIEYEVPDMFGRPSAQLWEKYFEAGMQRPDGDDIFDFSDESLAPSSRGGLARVQVCLVRAPARWCDQRFILSNAPPKKPSTLSSSMMSALPLRSLSWLCSKVCAFS
jgi:hypothetical protein